MVNAPDPAALDAARALKVRLVRRFGDRLTAVYLFGSRARGDHRPDSDADIAVVLKGTIDHPFAVRRTLIEDTYDLLLERGLYIQPWAIEEASLSHPEHPSAIPLAQAVLREGIPV